MKEPPYNSTTTPSEFQIIWDNLDVEKVKVKKRCPLITKLLMRIPEVGALDVLTDTSKAAGGSTELPLSIYMVTKSIILSVCYIKKTTRTRHQILAEL